MLRCLFAKIMAGRALANVCAWVFPDFYVSNYPSHRLFKYLVGKTRCRGCMPCQVDSCLSHHTRSTGLQTTTHNCTQIITKQTSNWFERPPYLTQGNWYYLVLLSLIATTSSVNKASCARPYATHMRDLAETELLFPIWQPAIVNMTHHWMSAFISLTTIFGVQSQLCHPSASRATCNFCPGVNIFDRQLSQSSSSYGPHWTRAIYRSAHDTTPCPVVQFWGGLYWATVCKCPNRQDTP